MPFKGDKPIGNIFVSDAGYSFELFLRYQGETEHEIFKEGFDTQEQAEDELFCIYDEWVENL